MSRYQAIDENDYKESIREAWKIEIKIKDWFPEPIFKWISHNATILGVPDTYIAIPFLVAVAYCSQHTTVTVDFHTEPLILYALVGGRSGTNKSASMQIILDIVNGIENQHGDASHTFDSGTLEGLMQSMRANNGCIMGCYDEFATFNDNLDKGNSGSSEKARYLSLYSGSSWSKRTKTSGCLEMNDPRFHMFAFTQPYYAAQFARNNLHDGFYQRFLLSLPREVYVKIDQKKDLLAKNETLLDMKITLEQIYTRCSQGNVRLTLTEDAKKLYEEHHDSIVDFRKEDPFEEARLSIKSKSLGLAMRLSGVISLMRCALNHQEENDEGDLVEEIDIKMAMNIVDYLVYNAFALLPNQVKSNCKSNEIKKIPLPKPGNLTGIFMSISVTKRLLNNTQIPLSLISRDKIYPVVNNISGSHIATKFVFGFKVCFSFIEII